MGLDVIKGPLQNYAECARASRGKNAPLCWPTLSMRAGITYYDNSMEIVVTEITKVIRLR